MRKRIAFLATNGFERSELERPYNELSNAGYEVFIVSPERDKIRSWEETDWGKDFKVDIELKDANPDAFDALVIPGGVINPDKLRTNPSAVKFVKAFFEGETQKPVGAICHGPWMLAEADVVKNRKMTSYKSIHTDLSNAGALWEDVEVVEDNGLVTSRSPDDLTAFIAKMKEVIEHG
ncbi:MAG: type 1 glutamine amidotransferase, partial [Bacteriovoracaceae bacterium]|nr:type 1 glutamine amidotransferase [Bacteriovoracaceae bacterium]